MEDLRNLITNNKKDYINYISDILAKDIIINEFFNNNEIPAVVFLNSNERNSNIELNEFNKETGIFSFDINLNLHGVGRFPFFESLENILLPYLLESVQLYLVYKEGYEIIRTIDDAEQVVWLWRDLTDLINNNIEAKSWEKLIYDDLRDLYYVYIELFLQDKQG